MTRISPALCVWIVVILVVAAFAFGMLWLGDDGWRCIRVFQGSTSDVTSVAISSNGKWLAGTSADRTLRIWDVRGGQERLCRDNAGNHVRFSPDCGRLVTWVWDPSHPRNTTVATVWDTITGAKTLEVKSDGPLKVVAFNDDGTQLVGLSYLYYERESFVVVWDATDGRQRLTYSLAETLKLKPLRYLHCAAISPSGNRIAVGVDDEVFVLDTLTGVIVNSLMGHTESVNCLDFSQDGRELVSVSNHRRDYVVHKRCYGTSGEPVDFGETVVWDLSTGKPRLTVKHPSSTPALYRAQREYYHVDAVAMSPDGQFLVVGWGEAVLDAKSGRRLRDLQRSVFGTNDIAFQRNGRSLAVCSRNHIWVWLAPKSPPH